MQIDNVGYDVQAMGELSEKEFIDLHMPNQGICHLAPEKEKTDTLKEHYRIIKIEFKKLKRQD